MVSGENVIPGNTGNGLHISGFGSDNNTVTGNRIGVTASSAEINPIANGQDGVLIDGGASSNTVDGGNVIAGNTRNGVHISGSGTNGNIIDGNYIGTDANDVSNLANGENGVKIDGGTEDNKIQNGNAISRNTENGVWIAPAARLRRWQHDEAQRKGWRRHRPHFSGESCAERQHDHGKQGERSPHFRRKCETELRRWQHDHVERKGRRRPGKRHGKERGH